jgi:3-hydroxyacyl-CoA dehydrogenase/enoyl-CoA hydratase/3-hydroxybutyryl-CoA epimerase
MKNLNLIIEEEIATITFDLVKQKVNKLSFEVLAQLDSLLDEIKDNTSIKALVIQSAKSNIFIAGADIKEIEAMKTEDEVYTQIIKGDEIFNKLEDLPFPTIAYINGACMGGGLELALACKYRVATTNIKTKLAFPEIKLGFFPGLGGTQRAPKIIGLINSLDLILTGKTIDSKKALRIGLVHELFDDGQKEFRLDKFIQKVIEGKIKNKKLSFLNNILEKYSLTREFVYYKTLKSIEKKVNRDFNAPYMALEVIKQTFNKPFEDGILVEARAFSKLAATKESKYMIELFFLFEKFNKDFQKTEKAISDVVVIGNGVMGKGIIWLFSKFLDEVRIKVRKIDQVHSIIKSVSKLYSSSIKKRSLTKNQVEFKLNKLSYTDTYKGMNNTQFAIEAIIEDENAKKETFEKLEEVLDKNSIIASNTSSISIEKLTSELKNKKNFLGVHFFNPVNMMPLVEVIPSTHTSKKTINRVKELLVSCGKTPIVVGDCAGFIVNRILLPYLNEAAFILEEGSDIKHIDKVLKDFGMPMGPFILADTVGIDIGYKVAQILKESYGERMPIAPVLSRVYNDLKLLGAKKGKGFYIHNKFSKNVNEEVIQPYNLNRQFTDEQIIQRCIYIMINEASRCLEEGVVKSADVINFAMITGTGFPPYKGGILNYANDIGLKNVLHCLNDLHSRYGKRFKPSNLLVKLVENKKNFKTGEELWIF